MGNGALPGTVSGEGTGDTGPVTPALRIDGLSFGWPGGPDLLSVPRFELAAGETVFLHGPSGSGKSTLLGLIGGVLTPRAGTITVAGQEMTGLGGAARDRLRADETGIVFQLFNLLPYLTAEENVLLPVRASRRRRERAGGNASERRCAARDLLARLGIDTPDRKAAALSVGQQQRVAAARALVGTPPLIIADEPTSALDEANRDAFLAILLAEANRAGSAVLFVSHDQRLVPRFDRSLSLEKLGT